MIYVDLILYNNCCSGCHYGLLWHWQINNVSHYVFENVWGRAEQLRSWTLCFFCQQNCVCLTLVSECLSLLFYECVSSIVWACVSASWPFLTTSFTFSSALKIRGWQSSFTVWHCSKTSMSYHVLFFFSRRISWLVCKI